MSASQPLSCLSSTNQATTLQSQSSILGIDNFSVGPQLQTAIAVVAPSSDPVESAEFNPLEYINSAFPSGISCSLFDENA